MSVWLPRARLVTRFLTVYLLAVLVVPLTADARSKPGPVTERGVAIQVSASGFTLKTAHDGSFHIVVTPDTTITESGKKVRLLEGYHVGVHGFLSGRSIRAIWVHIYSTAGPQFSLTGTVRSLTRGQIIVQSGGTSKTVTVDAKTTVTVVTTAGSIGDIRIGDRVLIRVQQRGSTLTALHIHVYRSAHRQRVSLSGTVISVSDGFVTVRTGTRQQRVRVPASAVIYLGADRASASSLHPGQSVRVYGCCAGTTVTATSIHIHRPVTHVVSEVLRGTILAVAAGRITVLVSGRSVTVIVDRGTRYEVGSTPSTFGGLRIGDEVTVRIHRVADRLSAVNVHVLAASRTPRTLEGTIVSVAGGRMSVLARGRRYILDLSHMPMVMLAGSRVPITALRPGDKVRAEGILHGTVLAVTSLLAVRPAPAVAIVRGTIVSIHGNVLVIADAFGARHTVHLAGNVHPQAHGASVPDAAVFAGVHAAARGTLHGRILEATSLQVSVEARAVRGRLIAIHSRWLDVLASGRHVSVDLIGAPLIRDRGRRIRAEALHAGAFAEVKGYTAAADHLRAVSILVLHPSLDITGTLVAGSHGSQVETATGDRYVLHISNVTDVSAGQARITVTMDDVPLGTSLHVIGTARSDGGISARTVLAHLASVTVRGRVESLAGGTVTVSTGGGQSVVRVAGDATVSQGARVLQLGDVVAGDDITVEGYQGKGIILARKVLVHRSLVGIDGVVQATNPNGFTMSTSVGAVQVVLQADTAMSGPVTAGLAVHVTGYRRGDGVILATRVRPK